MLDQLTHVFNRPLIMSNTHTYMDCDNGWMEFLKQLNDCFCIELFAIVCMEDVWKSYQPKVLIELLSTIGFLLQDWCYTSQSSVMSWSIVGKPYKFSFFSFFSYQSDLSETDHNTLMIQWASLLLSWLNRSLLLVAVVAWWNEDLFYTVALLGCINISPFFTKMPNWPVRFMNDMEYCYIDTRTECILPVISLKMT